MKEKEGTVQGDYRILGTEEAMDRLLGPGTDTSLWKKPLSRLLDEIEEGSTVLAERNGALVRLVGVAVIFLSADGRRFIAEKQARTLTEKINAGESPPDACRRGLEEELGFAPVADYEAPLSLGSFSETAPSRSYPGIDAEYAYHAFLVRALSSPPASHTDHDGKVLEFDFFALEELNHPHGQFVEMLQRALSSEGA